MSRIVETVDIDTDNDSMDIQDKDPSRESERFEYTINNEMRLRLTSIYEKLQAKQHDEAMKLLYNLIYDKIGRIVTV